VITLVIGGYYTFSSLEYEPRVVFMDVGQGDAILMIDENGHKILIDGGDGDYIVNIIPDYLHPRDRKINTLILTHPHQDHLSGLIDIVERYEVEQILFYPVCYDSELYNYFLGIEEEIKPIQSDYEYIGEAFDLELLYPLEDSTLDDFKVYSNINNASIVTRLVSEKGTMIFMGDAEHEQENVLLQEYSGFEMNSDILKAGHHCSRTASGRKFLKQVDPKYAICCVGEDNRFGHPHDEVIEKFEEFDIEYDLLYKTGDIVFKF